MIVVDFLPISTIDDYNDNPGVPIGTPLDKDHQLQQLHLRLHYIEHWRLEFRHWLDADSNDVSKSAHRLGRLHAI